jgi:hypothetical protein
VSKKQARRPARLTPAQQALVVGGLRQGMGVAEIARGIGLPKRRVWQGLPWDSPDEGVQALLARSLEVAVRQFAQALPGCREVSAGHEGPADERVGDGRPARKRRRRRKVKRGKPAAEPAAAQASEQADEETFAAVLERARARRELDRMEAAACVRSESEQPKDGPAAPTSHRVQSEEDLDLAVALEEQEVSLFVQGGAEGTNGVYEPG